MGGMFKPCREENGEQRSNSDNQTRLENRDTLGNSFCGRSSSRASTRSRGFSARYDKRIASESGAAIRAAVERRRTTCDTAKMITTTNHDSTVSNSKKETCACCFVHCAKLCAMCKGGYARLSLKRCSQ